MKLFFVLFLVFIAFSHHSFSQLVESVDVEIPLDENLIDDFSVVSLDTNGVLLIHFQTSILGKKGRLDFIKYDKDLRSQWANTIDPGPTFYLVKYFKGEDYLFCLLQENDSKKIKIVKIDLDRGDAITTESTMLTDMNVEFFAAIETKVVILGVYNDRPVAELHRLFDQTSKVLPQIHSNFLKVLSLEVNESEKQIYLMLKDEKKCQFKLSVFDIDGKMLFMKDLGDKKHVILNSKILKIAKNTYFLAGNFADNCSEFSSGFYVTPLNRTEDIQFFKFSELQNFYTYLSPKRQEKVKGRLQSKKLKGRDPKIRHRLNLQQPYVFDNQVLLVGEVYYPEYKNAMNYSRNSLLHLGENYRTTRDFNNYKFTQSLFCTFDFDGKKSWDYSVDLKNLESEVLNNKVQVSNSKEGILVAFPKEKTIFMKLISKDKSPIDFVPLNIGSKNKEFVSDVTVDLSSWYKQTFLAFGYKTAKSASTLGSKQFFYLKKLTYETPGLNSKTF
jgi:hypothetical protein